MPYSFGISPFRRIAMLFAIRAFFYASDVIHQYLAPAPGNQQSGEKNHRHGIKYRSNLATMSIHILDNASDIVIVDDDEMIVDLFLYLLKKYGLAAHGFTVPEDALQHMRATKSPPSLPITDYDMPGITGGKLIAEARGLFPELPCILISGGLHASEINIPDNTCFIEKPFRIPHAWSSIQKLLPAHLVTANQETIE